MYEKRLTLKRRYRMNKNGELVLQVQVEEIWFDGFWKTEYKWRDAKIEDLTIFEKSKGEFYEL